MEAAHRGEAFAAAQFIIDELKQKVPIWKKAAVLMGGTLTMFGVGAELTLFGILADVSGATSGWTAVFLIALALAALVVLAYALLTTYKLKLRG